MACIKLLLVCLLVSSSYCVDLHAGIGEDCEKPEDCVIGDHVICNTEGKCDCEGGSVSSGDLTQCLDIVHTIGGQCLEENQCKGGKPGPLSTCSNSVCNCTEEAAYAPGFHVCHKLAGLGESCVINQQCSQGSGGVYSMCNPLGNVCICNPGLSVKEGTTCLPKRFELDTPCIVNNQCQGEYTECSVTPEQPDSKTCHCLDTAIRQSENHHLCRLKRTQIDEDCSFDAQCTANIGNYSVCEKPDNKCKCNSESVANTVGTPNTKCLPANIFIGDSCFENQQCVGATTSVCTSVCDCIPSHVASMDRSNCLMIQNEIGSTCVENQQCYKGHLGELSICSGGNCRCDNTSVSPGNEHKCYKMALSVGEQCQRDVQCSARLGYSHCFPDTCICNENAASSMDKSRCILKSFLGEPCEQFEHGQCNHISHALCQTVTGTQQHTCQCDKTFMVNPVNSTTSCIKIAAKLGDSCLEHEDQCNNLDGALCDKNTMTCSCNSETDVPSSSGKRCLRKKSLLHESCLEDVQCDVQFSRCLLKQGSLLEKECKCPTTSIESSNKCLPRRQNYGQSCQVDMQCTEIGIGSTVKCSEGACKCPPASPTYYNDHCVRPSYLNGPCLNADECKVTAGEDSHCSGSEDTKLCSCTANAIEYDKRCYPIKLIGDQCSSELECKISIRGNVKCSSERCICAEGAEEGASGLSCNNGATSFQNFGTFSVIIFLMSVIGLNV